MSNIITDKIRSTAAKVDAAETLSPGERNLVVNVLRERAQKFERSAAATMSKPKIDSPAAEKLRLRINNYRTKIRLRKLMGCVE